MTFLCTVKLPSLEPWINQNEIRNIFENHFLFIRAEHQKIIRANCHRTYNEGYQKIIELRDWTLEKYKSDMEKTQQQNEQEVIIDNIIEELDNKRDIANTQKATSFTKR